MDPGLEHEWQAGICMGHDPVPWCKLHMLYLCAISLTHQHVLLRPCSRWTMYYLRPHAVQFCGQTWLQPASTTKPYFSISISLVRVSPTSSPPTHLYYFISNKTNGVQCTPGVNSLTSREDTGGKLTQHLQVSPSAEMGSTIRKTLTRASQLFKY